MSNTVPESAATRELSHPQLPTVLRDGQQISPRFNRDVNWEDFDSAAYWKHNYQTLRHDDQAIIQLVAEFFSQHFRAAHGMELLRGLDVGSGANLYPALALLPWSGRITLADISPANLAWLSRAAAGTGVEDDRGNWVWQPFWAEFARFPGYQQLANPRRLLSARHEVRRLDLLELGRSQGGVAGWDLGTMFFVAESISSYDGEFEAAVGAFARALAPGAPFATAFMDSSVGYTVAGRSFPAVRSVNFDLVSTVLSRFSADLVVTRVDVPAQNPASDGYQGMLVAVGTTIGAGPVISVRDRT